LAHSGMIIELRSKIMVDDEELLGSWDGNQRFVIFLRIWWDNGPVIQGSALGWIE
jgi:hypothetical protein